MTRTVKCGDVLDKYKDRPMELVTLKEPNVQVGVMSVFGALCYTENQKEGLQNSSEWDKIAQDFHEQVAKKVAKIMAKFLETHENVMPSAYSTQSCAQSLDSHYLELGVIKQTLS